MADPTLVVAVSHIERPVRWKGKPAKLIDGFTFTMPDTAKNQAEYPQPNSQKPGVGLPIGAAIGDDSSALIASPSPSIASSAVTLIGPPPPAAAVASSTATASNQATVFGPLPPSRIPVPTAAVSAARAQAHDVALLSDFIGPLPPDLWLIRLAAQQATEKAMRGSLSTLGFGVETTHQLMRKRRIAPA